MPDIIIVGRGLFGCIAATYLRQQGHGVTLIGDNRPGTGSAAAGCIIRPSWLTRMSKDDVARSLALLDGLYGLRDIRFRYKVAHISCHRIEPSLILSAPSVAGEVKSVAPGLVTLGTGAVMEAQHIVVAAGIWTAELCPWVKDLSARWGWSFRGPPVPEPLIHLWAPYRQVVAFNMDDGQSWVGDGSALTFLSEDKRVKSLSRCEQYAGVVLPEATLGARPYVHNLTAPAYVQQHEGVWAVTGGAKNGTAAAAWAALELGKAFA